MAKAVKGNTYHLSFQSGYSLIRNFVIKEIYVTVTGCFMDFSLSIPDIKSDC